MGKKGFASANVFANVAKKSNEKANVIQVKMIGSDDLVDYPKNHEDLSNTIDLENSMRELGFTDPIEVTTYNMEDDKYMIISGHRRRIAGVKVGMSTFPCIVRSFQNENDLRNYVLLANSQRDSSKDPLLYCKRYLMHEEYLRESGFKGSVREEIAKRLGISTQQSDRYHQFNKIIVPVWDMVRDEVVGMSSVLPMATHTVEEQGEILAILKECLEQEVRLTRDVCDKIIKGYRSGARMYAEILEENTVDKNPVRDSGLPLNSFINTEPSESKGNGANGPNDRNNEIRREYDPVNYDGNKDPLADERLTQEDYNAIDAVSKANEKEKEERKPLTEEEKKIKKGAEISNHLVSLEKCFDDYYTLPNNDAAEHTMKIMCKVTKMMFDELSQLGQNYDKDDVYKELLDDLRDSLGQYK